MHHQEHRENKWFWKHSPGIAFSRNNLRKTMNPNGFGNVSDVLRFLPDIVARADEPLEITHFWRWGILEPDRGSQGNTCMRAGRRRNARNTTKRTLFESLCAAAPGTVGKQMVSRRPAPAQKNLRRPDVFRGFPCAGGRKASYSKKLLFHRLLNF